MKPIFTFLAVFALLLLSFSVFYYLVLYLPKHNKENENSRQLQKEEEELYSRKNQCADDGKKYYATEVKNNPDNFYGEPMYHYNNKLKKCLIYFNYFNGSMYDKTFKTIDYIVDVHTGEQLAYSYIGPNTDTTNDETKSFDELKSELLEIDSE